MAEKDSVQPVGDIPDTEVVDIPGEDSRVCVLDSVTLDNGQPIRFSQGMPALQNSRKENNAEP